MTVSPTGSVALVTPWRTRLCGASISMVHRTTTPFGSFTSRKSQACGFTRSIRAIRPCNVIGWLASYSAANEWWARAVADARTSTADTVANVCLMAVTLAAPEHRREHARQRLVRCWRGLDGPPGHDAVGPHEHGARRRDASRGAEGPFRIAHRRA